MGGIRQSILTKNRGSNQLRLASARRGLAKLEMENLKLTGMILVAVTPEALFLSW